MPVPTSPPAGLTARALYGWLRRLTGAEIVGIRDDGGYFTGDTVEEALAELAAGIGITDVAAAAATELTIAAGIVTATQTYHTIDTQGDAGTDDLDTINGLADGQFYVFKNAAAARNVVFKHGTGNIINPSGRDITLDVTNDKVFGFSDGVSLFVLDMSLATATGGGLASALAAVANAQGASLVGIEDAATQITATTVEGALAEIVDTAQALVVDLASTANGDGASLIGIEDVAAQITATTVEGALVEIVDAAQALVVDLASTANGDGASLIGIEDVAGLYTATTVEAALAEARTTVVANEATGLTIAAGIITATQTYHTVDTEAAAASDDIDTINGLVDGGVYFFRMADITHNVVFKHASGNIFCPAGFDVTLDVATDCVLVLGIGAFAVVAAFKTDAFSGGGVGGRLNSAANGQGASLISIEDAATQITATTVEGALTEIVDTAQALVVDLAATTNGDGASLIGIEDVAAQITATTVEGALTEIVDTAQALVVDLASTANGDGASLIGIEDVNTYFTSTTVEAGLAELATYLVVATVAVADAALGATDALLSVQLNGLNNGAAIGDVRQVLLQINPSASQYIDSAGPAGTSTLGTVTAGAIIATIAAGSLYLVQTDATGLFAATVTNAVDETLAFAVKSAVGGVSAIGERCVVIGSNSDTATWSA